jgi:hypothetical protein
MGANQGKDTVTTKEEEVKDKFKAKLLKTLAMHTT